jgi:cyclopropane fatty-acyl-phospholipid synthase-like methyltransferase
MKPLKETVVIAMDGTDPDIFEFLPYIVQDIWEIGADPQAMIQLTEKYASNKSRLNVLDLGCGKGAVSVMMAKHLGCQVMGIDAIPEFVEYAKAKANEHGVDDLCNFLVGDIRIEAPKLKGFDVIILGAIGPVLGNYQETLLVLKDCANKDGMILIDDALIDDASNFSHPMVLKKSQLIEQAINAGYELLEIRPCSIDEVVESEEIIFKPLEIRCRELIKLHPEKAYLFENYIAKQKEEVDVNINKVTCATMAFKRKR